jgi:hypothetical protein
MACVAWGLATPLSARAVGDGDCGGHDAASAEPTSSLESLSGTSLAQPLHFS